MEVHSLYQVMDIQRETMSPSEKLMYAKLLSMMIYINGLGEETQTLYIQSAQEIVQDILNNQLVYNPR